MRPTIVAIVWLTVVWMALWGRVSAGNLVAGLLLGAAVTLLFGEFRPREGAHLRPVAAVRFLAVFVWMLLLSNIAVARKVLAPKVDVRPAVVSVLLPPSSQAVVALVANAVTLTPGTLSLDARVLPDGRAHLVVHALDAPVDHAVQEDVRRLHELAAAAFGPHGKEEP
jgi:multisubunit Na+/H+ antiporter MnhE subunit